MSKDSVRDMALFMVEVVTYAGDVVEETLGPFSQLQAGKVASAYAGLPKVYPAIRRATAAEQEAAVASLRKVVP